jgi:hypothetical protein
MKWAVEHQGLKISLHVRQEQSDFSIRYKFDFCWELIPYRLSSINHEFIELIIRLIGGCVAPSSLTEGSLLRPPWLAKQARKMI